MTPVFTVPVFTGRKHGPREHGCVPSMLEVELIGQRGRMVTRSGRDVTEAEQNYVANI